MLIIFFFIMFFLVLSSAVAVINFFTAPRMSGITDTSGDPRSVPFLSILIPARNEEANIGRCISSVLSQTYENFEVIVLNDSSEDNTVKEACLAAGEDRRVRIIEGLPLNSPWLGKNWACRQLSSEAKGEVLLFIDADVLLSPEAVKYAVNNVIRNNLGMLSVFPTQIMKTPGEYLIVPMMNWLLLSFLPLRLVSLTSNPALCAANGQFIMMTRAAYEKTGGHEAVRSEIVEDMELAKNTKKAGLRLMTVLGAEAVKCRMYKNYNDAFAGFSKNFFAGFKMPAAVFRRLLDLSMLLFFMPFIFAVFFKPFIIAAGLILFSRILISLMSGQNAIYNLILHPVQMAVFYATGIKSIKLKLNGKIVWKDRTY